MQLLTQVLALIFVISTMLAVALQLTPRDITAALHDRPWLGRALLAATKSATNFGCASALP